ncbi:hypothetical protein TgHK011_005305 [Trichoderma gracile]|nr:hypothetical protein TgHK011_005305 [Trichoderma gracile]
MGKLQDVTRLLMAAGGSPSDDGEATHLLHEKNNCLYMETWTGPERADRVRVVENVRNGTSAPLISLKYKRIFTVDKANKLRCFTETLNAENEDEEDECWEEERLEGVDVKVHGQSRLAVSCADEAVIVLFQNPDGSLGAIEDDGDIWKLAELPSCMASPGSPLACLRTEEASYFVYVGTEGTLRYLEHGPVGWKDAPFSNIKIDVAKSRLFAANDDKSSSGPKLMVFCLADDTFTAIRRDSDEAEILGTVHKGEFKPASDQESVCEGRTRRALILKTPTRLPRNPLTTLHLLHLEALHVPGSKLVLTPNPFIVLLLKHNIKRLNELLVKEPQTLKPLAGILLPSNVHPNPLVGLSTSRSKSTLKKMKYTMKIMTMRLLCRPPRNQYSGQLRGMLSVLFSNGLVNSNLLVLHVLASSIPTKPLPSMLKRQTKNLLKMSVLRKSMLNKRPTRKSPTKKSLWKTSPLRMSLLSPPPDLLRDLLEEMLRLLFSNSPVNDSRFGSQLLQLLVSLHVSEVLASPIMMKNSMKNPLRSQLRNPLRSPLRSTPLRALLHPPSVPHRETLKTPLNNNRPVNGNRFASNLFVKSLFVKSLLARVCPSGHLFAGPMMSHSKRPFKRAWRRPWKTPGQDLQLHDPYKPPSDLLRDFLLELPRDSSSSSSSSSNNNSNNKDNDNLLVSQPFERTCPDSYPSGNETSLKNTSKTSINMSRVPPCTASHSHGGISGLARSTMEMIRDMTLTNPSSHLWAMSPVNINNPITLHSLANHFPSHPEHIIMNLPLIAQIFANSITDRTLVSILCILMRILYTLTPIFHMLTPIRATQTTIMAAPLTQGLLWGRAWRTIFSGIDVLNLKNEPGMIEPET